MSDADTTACLLLVASLLGAALAWGVFLSRDEVTQRRCYNLPAAFTGLCLSLLAFAVVVRIF